LLHPAPEGLYLSGPVSVAPDGALWMSAESGVVRFEPAPTGGDAAPGAWTLTAWEGDGTQISGPVAFGPDGEVWFGATRLQPDAARAERLEASPPQKVTPDPLVTPRATNEPETTPPAGASVGSAVTGAPALRWDTNPEALVIRYYSPSTTAGLSGAYDADYYIPEVQLWGDGRIIWVAREGTARRVMEGHLTVEQMRALIRRITDAGFFDWQDRYFTLGGNSSPPMLLSVQLSEVFKVVSEHGGAPEAYYDLVAFLKAGAGSEGQAYMPALGYLTATPWPVEAEAPRWPDESTGITLDQVGEGRYIEGEALAFAWQAVNRNPTAPVYVQSKGHVYTIMLQIPGVSLSEPPPRQP
jgi:hypothetical protein